jgi:phosphoglycolate phosphatase
MAAREIPAKQIKLVIFDLDGTLIDSRRDLAESVNAMLRHLGHRELPMDVIASYVGDGAPMLVRRALGDPEDEQYVLSALKFFLDYYREHKLDHTVLYAGVREALDAVTDTTNGSRRRLAVLSNKPVRPSQQIVEALGLGGFFSQVYGGNSFSTKKPDPLGVQTLLTENTATAEETVIVGDSDIDVLTARNAGIYSIGVSYGFAPHTLEAAPPDVMVSTPHQWAEVLRG